MDKIFSCCFQLKIHDVDNMNTENYKGHVPYLALYIIFKFYLFYTVINYCHIK